MILPSAAFEVPFKKIADRMVQKRPKMFLKELQAALAGQTTQPMTKAEKALSDRFDKLFAKPKRARQLAKGAQRAHKRILSNYHKNTLPRSTWINFENMGDWNRSFKGYRDRSSITEYVQYANNFSAAAYYQSFLDKNHRVLNGKNHIYIVKFSKRQLPAVKRFWSLTAYVPNSIALVPNKANKYAVASYTPKLVKGRSGSVKITLAHKRPKGTPKANWLPIPNGPFNIILRAYGPQGSVARGDYTPPPIRILPLP